MRIIIVIIRLDNRDNMFIKYILMDNIDLILDTIHSKITLKQGGNMKSEYSEQRLAIEFLTPESKVLELGSNIGINSIIISNILSNDTNLVTLECDLTHIDTLRYNRDINNLHFNIEASALSSIPLGRRGWHTFPMTPNEANLIPVNTITYEQLLSKYGVHFDTIVADCEGALYYILKDMPYILANIKLIIVENDYIQLDHKLFVDNVLASYNFKLIKSVPGGFDNSPCYNCFYQVFAK